MSSCEVEQVATQTYRQQEGIVRISVATRGSYQFIIQPDKNNLSQNYLVTNYADSLKSYFMAYSGTVNELAVIFSGVTSPEKGTIYKPAPTDGPEPAYELPTIRLTALQRK